MIIKTILAAVTVASTLAVAAPTAQATAGEPYGGCKEVVQGGVVAVDTPGADDCRAQGWVIRKRLVVGPHGWVKFSRLPHCAVEDASYGPVPCSWNFGGRQDGNGYGDQYYVIKPQGHARWYMGVHVSPRADVR